MGRLNKPAKPGYKYANPSQTSARDLTPNLLEEVGPSQEADIGRIKRGVNPTAKGEYNRRRQQEAGGRATLRSLGRAGLLGAAAEAGEAIGREIDERNPEVGEAVERILERSGASKALQRGAVPPGRVELTDEAKEEQAFRDVEDAARKVRDMGYAKGGSVGSASKRGDGIAQRGKTRGRYL